MILSPVGEVVINDNGSLSVITPNGQKLSMLEAEKLKAKVEHKEPENSYLYNGGLNDCC